MKSTCLKLFVLLISLLLGEVKAQKDVFFEQILLPNAPTTSIHGISKDSIGYIWFGSWHGLYRYDGVRFKMYQHHPGDSTSLPANRIKNVVTDDNKQLWILTFDRSYVRYRYDLDQFIRVQDSAVPSNVSLMLNSSPNLINRRSLIGDLRFVIQDHHMTTYNRRSREEVVFNTNIFQPGHLTDDYVTSFYVDAQDIVWVGTRSGEIYRINTHRKPFILRHVYANPNSRMKPLSIRAILHDGAHLWLGSNHNGLIVEGANGSQSTRLPNKLAIRSLFQDENQHIWIGSFDGLYRYTPKTNQFIEILSRNLQADLGISSVYAMADSKQKGYFWAGMFNRVLKIHASSRSIERYSLEDTLLDRSIMCMAESPDGSVWLGTEGRGVFQVRLAEQGTYTILQHLHTQASDSLQIAGDLVYALYVDAKSCIWIGSSDGLDCYDVRRNRVVPLPQAKDIADPYVSAITEDKQGYIWLSHKKGISKLEKSSYRVSNYPIRDNQREWSFLDGACYNDTINNTIYFGSTKGYVAFHPEQITLNPHVPIVVFNGIQIAGEKVEPFEAVNGQVILNKAMPLTRTLDLNYSNRSFSIQLASLHYDHPQDNRFLYQLEGYDTHWIETNLPELDFVKLPAGSYVLKVKSISPDNVSSETLRLHIQIRAPWYASNWAYLLYVALVILLVLLVHNEIMSRERLKHRVLLERMDIEKREELNRDRQQFFTNVSHALRTPLTLISDPVKQLQDDRLSSESRSRYISIVNRNVEHLTTLINQLLDFRKTEAGKLEVHKQAYDVVALLRKGVDSFHMNAYQRNIHLTYISQRDALWALMDRPKMEQILYNLVSNAFKYTPNGGNILVELNVVEQAIQLKVVDNGIGMDAKAQQKAFEPFNSLGAQPFQGSTTGMGLALTRNMVQLMGGQIHLESAYQKGTKVLVSLPLEVVDPPVVENVEVAEALTLKEVDSNKPVILVVEDHEDVRSYLENELRDRYQVLVAAHGLDGLNTAMEQIPDLIVSDVMMPFMDGVALCKELKQNERTAHIPVLLLTAKTDDQHQIEGLQSGADMYVSKPFSMEVLKAQISGLLENRARLQATLGKKAYVQDLAEANNQIDNAFLLKVVEIIHLNMSQAGFNGEALSDALKLSQRQLYRKLKALSGSTVQEFIVRVKLDEAARLLRETDMNVTEISYRLGFSEPSNFTRTFTKHFGDSPGRWAKLNRAGS